MKRPFKNSEMEKLFLAARKGNDDQLLKYIQEGCDINCCNDNNSNLLHCAIESNQISVVQVLLKKGIDVNHQNKNGIAPIHIAFEKGENDIISLLINNKSNIFIKDNILFRLILVSINNKSNVVNILNSVELSEELFDNDQYTPIHYACKYNSNDFLREYLNIHNQFINPNISKSNTWAPLHIAVSQNNMDAVQILLSHNANINIPGENNFTALHVAAGKSNSSMVKYLLENGANPNYPNSNFDSPLMISIKSNDLDVVRILLDAGADVNMANKIKTTPLHLACQNKSEAIIDILLKYHANVNALDDTDSSPLYYSVQLEDIPYTRKLIDHGANPLLRNSSGQSILSLSKNHEIQTILRKGVSKSEMFIKRKDAINKHGQNSRIDDLESSPDAGIDISFSDDDDCNHFSEEGEEFNEFEEEEEECTEDEQRQFIEFRQEVESQIMAMQSGMLQQMGEMMQMLKSLVQQKRELERKAPKRKH